jgi:hypothetical protein
MPIHDWTRVEAGIFHDFHHAWIEELKRVLNRGILPPEYYALAELQPAETYIAFYYRRKQSSVAVRHASGDKIIAIIEIISPGNKVSQSSLRDFVKEAASLLDYRIHLLILDLLPPSKHDPQGIHREIWEEVASQEYTAPADMPRTLAAYESGLGIRCYVENVAVGDTLTDMPLFLEPDRAVEVPLEATYNAAFAEVLWRWRRVLETPRPTGSQETT